MSTNQAMLEQEREIRDSFVLSILRKAAPQEIDIYDTICEELYAAMDEMPEDQVVEKQMFAFAPAELQTYLSSILVLVAEYIVKPFLKKACDRAIEATAEESVDGLAKKLHDVVTKLKKGDQSTPIAKIDVLVPINPDQLLRYLKTESQKLGLSKKRASEVADLTVRELSENEVLLGEMLLTVMRVPLSGTDYERRIL